MKTTEATALRAIGAALDEFKDYIAVTSTAERVDLDDLLTSYVLLRSALVEQVEILSNGLLLMDDPALAKLTRQVEAKMVELFSEVAPASLLLVKGYNLIHMILYQYLARHASKPCSVSRLRALVGDQVHTERRVRDLRDLGLSITWRRTGGEDRYTLEPIPDLVVGAYRQLRVNLRRESTRLPSAMRVRLSALIDAAPKKID